MTSWSFNLDAATDSAVVGVVEGVGANSIDVAIAREAPHGTGLYEGEIHRFPRLNGLVVLPSERGAVLAIVTWVGSDPDDPADGARDRIGLPSPRRRLRAQPLGVLIHRGASVHPEDNAVELDRGVLVFPTVGDPVRLPTVQEAKAIAPAPSSEVVVRLGRAPLAAGANALLDPSRLYGRHLAVLGNTGSGKSCSVAHLLRASVEATGALPKGFRAVVLDLNGEYAKAFDDLGEHVTVVRLGVGGDQGAGPLRVPYWLWNFREWLSFSDATAKSQAPLLRRSLHLLRSTGVGNIPTGVVHLVAARRVVRRYTSGAVDGKDQNKGCLEVLAYAQASLATIREQVDDTTVIDELHGALAAVLASRRSGKPDFPWVFDPALVSPAECKALDAALAGAIEQLGIPEFLGDEVNVDSPCPFDAEVLLDLLPLMAADAGADAVGWVMPMVERLRIAMADHRLRSVAGWDSDESLADLLEHLLGDGSGARIAVLDLSLVPTHVLHVVAAVLARLLLEAHERFRRLNDGALIPTLLVVEEAHALLRRHLGSESEDQAVSAARLCREAFERVSREGRKFGLSLVISSQRPSEVSETVLSQCNTFLVHRIVNDIDQRLVRRLMPDSLGALAEELPALPSQVALLVGWAVEIPILVRVEDLPRQYRPSSSDPDLSAAWRDGGAIDWSTVAGDWSNPVAPAGDDDAVEAPP